MAIGVGRNRRAPMPTNADDAATEADFLCALRKCVLLLASITAASTSLSVTDEPDEDDVSVALGIDTVRSMVFVYGNATAFAASVFILLWLLSKVLGTQGIKYSQLQFIITLDVLGLIGAYIATSMKTSISVVTLVAVVLLYVAIQVLLFLSKPVERLFSHVEEAPPQKCLKFEKRIHRQQTIVSTQGKDVDPATVKKLFISMSIFLVQLTSIAYDLDTQITYPETTQFVQFGWNDTASVASLVFILIVVVSSVFREQRIMCRALEVAMTLDLFTLVVAYASRGVPEMPTFVYISIVAPVSLYAGIHVMVFMSEMFLTCMTWRRMLSEKMEQYCVPNWLNTLFEMPINEHTDEEAMGCNLVVMRQHVLITAITMANLTQLASKNLSRSLQLESRSCPGHVVDNCTFHSSEFYVGNLTLTDQAGMSSLSSLWQKNTSDHAIGNLIHLPFYCYATAFTGFLAIIVLLANRKFSSRGIHCYALQLCMVLGLICCVGTLAAGLAGLPKLYDEHVSEEEVFLLLFSVACPFISLRGPKERVQSILGWLQQTLRADPLEEVEEGPEDELEFGLAGGGTNGEPVAVEISSPILGEALTLVLAIPVMCMLASPVKMLVAFVIASSGAELWRRLFARLLQALVRALQRRCVLQDQGSAPPGFGTTSMARRGWHMVSATCHGLCKIIQALCSGTWVWILVLVIWMPSLKPNLKLKFKISKISALLGVLIALATTTTATTIMDSPTMATTATGARTSGTSTRRHKHPPRVEPRPRRNCRPNTRLISEEWVN